MFGINVPSFGDGHLALLVFDQHRRAANVDVASQVYVLQILQVLARLFDIIENSYKQLNLFCLRTTLLPIVAYYRDGGQFLYGFLVQL